MLPTDPSELVSQFCDEWTNPNPDRMIEYFTDDAIYHNIPMDPAVGKDAIKATFEGMGAMIESIRFETLKQVANGDTVMNERIDHLSMGGNIIPLPVMGVFEIVDGRIHRWRDYFDLATFTGQG